MIHAETLRQVLQLMGYKDQDIEEILPLLYNELVTQQWQQYEATLEAMRAKLQEAAESMEALTQAIAAAYSREREELPRPPRYVGPKSPQHIQRPRQCARSSCRRVRR